MNNNLDLTFLTIEQVEDLEILKKYGKKAEPTDFAILLGSYVTSGWWWTKSLTDGDNVARVVSPDGCVGSPYGCEVWDDVDSRFTGARPAIPYSSIQQVSSNGVIGASGIKEILYGEYPQTIVDENYSRELERAYNNGSLRTTGKNYTTDSVRYQDYDTNFRPRAHTEYEYNGSKYIRFVGDSNCDGEVLSDGRTIQSENTYWVRVEPITWLVDERANIALSKKLIFSGVQFKNRRDYKGDFDRTDIKQFMDNYFSKEIVSDRVYSQTTSVEQIQNLEEKEPVRKQNPYGFNFDGVSEEDIIRGAVESNVSVFLHGRSSEGKSARVKQLDPDCEIIYMRNATPDSLNGKSVYNAATGEMIDVPPTWYSKVKEKCEAEPDKIHIIFFDELTNALPSIQGMAFNIVLDGEVNGKWKLPPNARIVAAGNDLNDSLAANQMAEPLFNRFAHVYIHTTVDSWLKWASKNNIHPAIYSYIAYKGESVLRTEYDGKHPNANPRKWEMASKVLFQTKNPNMLKSLVGEEITNEFIMFCKQKVITLEDVLNNNYIKEEVYYLNLAEKYATIMNLSQVGEENLECVRDFVSLMGKEFLATFDSLWIHGDNERLKVIADLKSGSSLVRKKDESR